MRSTQVSIVAISLALSACATPRHLPEAAPAPSAREWAENDDANLDVWLLDIGQGSCVYVDCPDGARPLIVDCGSKGRSIGAGGNGDPDVTTAWIAQQLDRHADPPRIVVSHADTDHFNLIPAAVAAQRASELFLGSPYARHEAEFQAWIDDVGHHGGDVYYFPQGSTSFDDDDLRCGSAVSDVLIANATGGEIDNADSIVLAITYERLSFVFAGDAEGNEGSAEPLALRSRAELPYLRRNQIVLSASHHGASTADSNSPTWAHEWNVGSALYAVSFSARPTTHRHPVCEVVTRYSDNMNDAVAPFRLRCDGSGSTEVSDRILSAHENGHILFRVNPEGVRIYCEVFTPACPARYQLVSACPGVK